MLLMDTVSAVKGIFFLVTEVFVCWERKENFYSSPKYQCLVTNIFYLCNSFCYTEQYLYSSFCFTLVSNTSITNKDFLLSGALQLAIVNK